MEEQTTYDKTATVRQSTGPTLHPEYLRSRAGILKIVEIVLSLLTFICSLVNYWGGQEWAEFVSITAFLTTLIYLIFHLLNLISRFPGPWLLIEFIYYLVFAVFYLIAAIVAAARAGYHASIGATAFFAFAATAVYTVDTVFQFRAWHGGEAGIATRTTTTTTTTVDSHAATERGRTAY